MQETFNWPKAAVYIFAIIAFVVIVLPLVLLLVVSIAPPNALPWILAAMQIMSGFMPDTVVHIIFDPQTIMEATNETITK